MTMTSPAHAGRDVPAWLNLSALVDDATLEELEVVAAEVKALEEQVRSVCIRAFRVTTRYTLMVDGLPNGVYEVVDQRTGCQAVHDGLHAIVGQLEVTLHEPTSWVGSEPDWVADEARAIIDELGTAPSWLAKYLPGEGEQEDAR